MTRGAFVVVVAVLAAGSDGAARAGVGPVFVIALENHNFTQPSIFTEVNPLYGNPAAPYLNSLVTPGDANARYSSYCTNYRNVPGLHPSEPNYIWSEAGDNFGVDTSADPYGPGGNNQATDQHLAGLLQRAGRNWRSYQEDTDLVTNADGNLTATPLPAAQYTVPLASFSGRSDAYANPYNGSHQYDYACKHNPQVFFTDTNGGNDPTPGNALSARYAPMQQLAGDLSAGTYADYNWITPDQFNDMHTALDGGFTYNGVTWQGDDANVAQGDKFLSVVVPMLLASDAFQNRNATIILWTDECEGEEDGIPGDFRATEIVLSKLAKGNAYASTITYDHSSGLRTMQEIFQVGDESGGFLRAAAGATDLSDLFLPGVIPNGLSVPEPGAVLPCVAATGLLARRTRRR